MKKKILSLLVTGCLLFVPTTAFADDNKTVIKTVDDLLAFSKAVNNGDYDKNKDAVVVLENDLDLPGLIVGVTVVSISPSLSRSMLIKNEPSDKFKNNTDPLFTEILVYK